jgi:Uncharacterized flagellar protein FlaG
MALDVSSIQYSSPALYESARRLASSGSAAQEPKVPEDLRSTVRELQTMSEAYNRRLSFSINEKLNEVVVKVIDTNTDKVVREIPPTELQRVYERIREALGLLIDKSA